MPVVEDLLGAGENRAEIATRDGETLFEVPAGSIDWGRELCAVSRATVVVDPAKCTPALGDVHPWAHSLVVYRNEERVWEGPLRKRRDTRTGLTLEASDVLGYPERRPVTTRRNVLGGFVRDHMAWSVNQAFAADDPNVLAYLQALGTPTSTSDLVVGVGEKYHGTVLSDLTGVGGRWTALGRSIILWDETQSIGQLRDLSPENHLLNDVEVIEDGDLLGTEVVARNDTGIVGTGIHTGGSPVDPYYGQVTLLVASTGATPAGVTSTAQSTADRSWPTPLAIVVPGDAALRCEAPFPIHRLVPGVLVPVTTTTATARTVTGTFVLSSVSVTQKAGQDEKVTITLTPLSGALE